MNKLTDEQVDQYWRQANQRDDSWMPFIHVRFARAIEAAATEPLLQRIAELEQRNSDLHEDVQRFKKHALNERAARMELERQLEESRNQVLEEAAKVCEEKHANGNWKHDTRHECAAAIRALKGAKE